MKEEVRQQLSQLSFAAGTAAPLPSPSTRRALLGEGCQEAPSIPGELWVLLIIGETYAQTCVSSFLKH